MMSKIFERLISSTNDGLIPWSYDEDDETYSYTHIFNFGSECKFTCTSHRLHIESNTPAYKLSSLFDDKLNEQLLAAIQQSVEYYQQRNAFLEMLYHSLPNSGQSNG